jgi:hypothetical protein
VEYEFEKDSSLDRTGVMGCTKPKRPPTSLTVIVLLVFFSSHETYASSSTTCIVGTDGNGFTARRRVPLCPFGIRVGPRDRHVCDVCFMRQLDPSLSTVVLNLLGDYENHFEEGKHSRNPIGFSLAHPQRSFCASLTPPHLPQ